MAQQSNFPGGRDVGLAESFGIRQWLFRVDAVALRIKERAQFFTPAPWYAALNASLS